MLFTSAYFDYFLAGIVLLKEKHRVSPAPLMTIGQYLQELRSLVQELSSRIEASLEPTTNRSPAEATESQRDGWLKRLESLQRILDTHAGINPEKLVADWVVYTGCETVEVIRLPQHEVARW